MKKLLIIIVCFAFSTFSSAIASPRVGQRPEGICTRDFNLWGNASQCSCDEGKVYDDRAGVCLEAGDGKKILVQGAISANMAAIGGETTGFVIKTPEEDSYELIIKTVDQDTLKKLGGLWFEVGGEIIIIKSVEMKARQAIIVEKLTVLE